MSERQIVDFGDDDVDEAMIRGLERALEHGDKDAKAELPPPTPPPDGVKVDGKLRRVKAGVARNIRVLRHYGPGPHPSGSEQAAHAGSGGSGQKATGDGTISVGITSNKEGREPAQVFEEMRDFEAGMRQLSGVSGVSVKPGVGGWDGGSEPTWVVEYQGNGEALSLIAQTGKEFNQDAVMLMRAATPDNSEPVVDWTFDEALSPTARDRIERMLVAAGGGGWTWFRSRNGRRTLRVVNVPRWSGRNAAEHLRMADSLSADLAQAGLRFSVTNSNAAVDLMERVGEDAYDNYIRD